MARPRNIYISNLPFFFGEQFFKKGTRVRSDHPALAAYPDAFERIDKDLPDVEQATAAPGERRDVTLQTIED